MLRLIAKLVFASMGWFSLLSEKVVKGGQHAFKSNSSNFDPVSTVEYVDLERYQGIWYEIARLPNFFEKPDMRDIKAEYKPISADTISVQNSSTRGGGKHSYVLGIGQTIDESNAKLKVTFAPAWIRALPIVWGDYWIIGLDENYHWAVIGGPTRQYFWILCRAPQMDQQLYEHLCDIGRGQRFAVENLIRPQHGQ